jgi:dTDP-4-dehydrorhamnose 3,5-epimerase
VTRHGFTTELFSASWNLPTTAAAHAIFVSLKPGAVSAWHRHAGQTDHIAATDGMLKLVLFDPRPDSPTHGRVQVMHLGPQRPTLVVIPPGLWHGLANMLPHAFSSFVNLFDRPYDHHEPDEYRLPLDNSVIPYRFDAD